MFDVLGAVDNLPDLIFGEHVGKLARFLTQTETDLKVLIQNVFVEKVQAGQNEAATGGSIALIVFQIEQIVLDHLLGDGFRRGLIVFWSSRSQHSNKNAWCDGRGSLDPFA
jgi:hypothetical protein